MVLHQQQQLTGQQPCDLNPCALVVELPFTFIKLIYLIKSTCVLGRSMHHVPDFVVPFFGCCPMSRFQNKQTKVVQFLSFFVGKQRILQPFFVCFRTCSWNNPQKKGLQMRNMMHRKAENTCRMFVSINVNGKFNQYMCVHWSKAITCLQVCICCCSQSVAAAFLDVQRAVTTSLF